MSHEYEPRRRSSVRDDSLADSTSTRHRHRTEGHTAHRRRRRKPVEELDDGGDAHVYRDFDESNVEPSSASLRSSRRQVEDERASFIPGILPVLRTLGLDTVARSTEHREEQKPRRTSTVRRRSYDEGDKVVHVRTVRRTHSDNVDHASTSTPRAARSVSMRETASRSDARPRVVRRHSSSTQKVRRLSHEEISLPTVHEESRPPPNIPKKVERSSHSLGSIFGVTKEAKPTVQVECLTCLSDDIPISKSAKLACGHRMCHSCLRRIFTMSVSDPAHMPPTCCTSDHIPLKHVDKLFDVKFKMKWNKKYQEYTTKNRVYCPAKGCGEWIKPANIHLDTSGGANSGRRYGKCGRCRTKVCVLCNGKWHISRECPKDEATAKFAEVAKQEGWQRCFNCSAMVELKEGCNHMTCRCRAEFCMICGVKWKGCDCPWFNYQAVENDRLNHLNIAQARAQGLRADGMPRAYHEELERRREQERRDEALARRMQRYNIADNNYPGGIFELGNAAGHFMNEDFMQRAANILTANYGRTQHNAADVLQAEMGAGGTGQRGHHAVPPPPPPPQIPGPPPLPPQLLRMGSTRSRRINLPQTRLSERLVPQLVVSDHAPEVIRNQAPMPQVPVRAVSTTTRPSTLAGLTRSTTEGRVDAWRRHVEDDESAPVL